jgi:hypothetical protein
MRNFFAATFDALHALVQALGVLVVGLVALGYVLDHLAADKARLCVGTVIGANDETWGPNRIRWRYETEKHIERLRTLPAMQQEAQRITAACGQFVSIDVASPTKVRVWTQGRMGVSPNTEVEAFGAVALIAGFFWLLSAALGRVARALRQ